MCLPPEASIVIRAFGHSFSLAGRNTASVSRPPGFIARRTFAKTATGSLKNMIPKRENVSSKLPGGKGWTEASATMTSACRRRQQRSVHAPGRPMALRHLRRGHDRPGQHASPARELSCRGRTQYRVRAPPAGEPPNPIAPLLERRPHDPFVRTGRPTPAWRRYSRIQSAPRSL